MECCMMSRTRAQALAEALRKKHRRRAKAIDAEQEREPLDHDWLETGPIAELVAWIDIEKLLGQLH
jgi:hypothetical protein